MPLRLRLVSLNKEVSMTQHRQAAGKTAGAGLRAIRRRGGVLRFGEFKTKAGRQSPYFFNAGLFDDGAKLGRLARILCTRLLASGIEFDMMFGPAYKGIRWRGGGRRAGAPGRNVPFAYNRKEAKDHGEGGTLVGARCRAGC
jgi:orotate phosphoribosyltransferase